MALVLRGLLSRSGRCRPSPCRVCCSASPTSTRRRGAGNIGLVLVLAAVGVAFGGAAYLLRRIGPTILAHAIFNGVVMAVVLLS